MFTPEIIAEAKNTLTVEPFEATLYYKKNKIEKSRKTTLFCKVNYFTENCLILKTQWESITLAFKENEVRLVSKNLKGVIKQGTTIKFRKGTNEVVIYEYKPGVVKNNTYNWFLSPYSPVHKITKDFFVYVREDLPETNKYSYTVKCLENLYFIAINFAFKLNIISDNKILPLQKLIFPHLIPPSGIPKNYIRPIRRVLRNDDISMQIKGLSSILFNKKVPNSFLNRLVKSYKYSENKEIYLYSSIVNTLNHLHNSNLKRDTLNKLLELGIEKIPNTFFFTVLMRRGIKENSLIRLLYKFYNNDGYPRSYIIDDTANMATSVIGDNFNWGKRIRCLKELHDDLAKVQKKLGSVLQQCPITPLSSYLEDKKILEYDLSLPKNNHQLISWGEDFKNCVGAYFFKILSGESIIISLKYKNKKVYCVELNNNLDIKQCSGIANTPINSMELNLIKEEFNKLYKNFNKQINIEKSNL